MYTCSMKQQGKFLSLLVIYAKCNSYTVVCLPVRGDNPRALASGLSHVQVDNHIVTILYHLHQCCQFTFQVGKDGITLFHYISGSKTLNIIFMNSWGVFFDCGTSVLFSTVHIVTRSCFRIVTKPTKTRVYQLNIQISRVIHCWALWYM